MKSNSTICFAALAASLLFLAFSANGQDIRIHGKVIDAATLLPVQQASVFLAHLPVRAVSDSAGTFILTNVPEGEFELRVTKPGYLPYRRFAKSGDGTYQILIKLNADTLSTTHEPGRQVSTLQSLREKIYVCTDKPYYYPGEIIWFAGYFSYFDRTKKDSLSRVAYVDVIGPDRNIIAKKMIPVDNGMINGHIQLPQDLRRGQYLMRSYTTWMLNFADEDIFYKPVPVLDLFESVDRDALTSRKRAAKTAHQTQRPRNVQHWFNEHLVAPVKVSSILCHQL